MAKMDVLKALAVLAEQGIELSEDQTAALEELKMSAMRENALAVMEKKVSGDAMQWCEEMFDLAAAIFDGIEGKIVGRGRGEVFERVFRIETPHGSLKVSLTNGEED